VAPYTRQPLRRIVPSALVGALLFEISKLGFVLYLRRFGGYSVVFGSLGAVAAFLFWVYVEAIILLVGAELAAPARRT
jgi:membrane protein